MIIIFIGVILYLIFCLILGVVIVAGGAGFGLAKNLKGHKYVRIAFFFITFVLILVFLFNLVKDNSRKANLSIKDNKINEELNDFKNINSHSIKTLDDNSELLITDDYKIYNYNGEELEKFKKKSYKIENSLENGEVADRNVCIQTSMKKWLDEGKTECKGNDWLNKSDAECTITPHSHDDNIFYISSYGVLTSGNAGIASSTRPTIYLKSSVKITSGKGTEDEPFKLSL